LAERPTWTIKITPRATAAVLLVGVFLVTLTANALATRYVTPPYRMTTPDEQAQISSIFGGDVDSATLASIYLSEPGETCRTIPRYEYLCGKSYLVRSPSGITLDGAVGALFLGAIAGGASWLVVALIARRPRLRFEVRDGQHRE
jgi:hypothetical protein